MDMTGWFSVKRALGNIGISLGVRVLRCKGNICFHYFIYPRCCRYYRIIQSLVQRPGIGSRRGVVTIDIKPLLVHSWQAFAIDIWRAILHYFNGHGDVKGTSAISYTFNSKDFQCQLAVIQTIHVIIVNCLVSFLASVAVTD